ASQSFALIRARSVPAFHPPAAAGRPGNEGRLPVGRAARGGLSLTKFLTQTHLHGAARTRPVFRGGSNRREQAGTLPRPDDFFSSSRSYPTSRGRDSPRTTRIRRRPERGDPAPASSGRSSFRVVASLPGEGAGVEDVDRAGPGVDGQVGAVGAEHRP